VGLDADEHRVPARDPGEQCIHHVYKDVDATPAGAYVRIGKAPPTTAR
jgi:hypothetical protein